MNHNVYRIIYRSKLLIPKALFITLLGYLLNVFDSFSQVLRPISCEWITTLSTWLLIVFIRVLNQYDLIMDRSILFDLFVKHTLDDRHNYYQTSSTSSSSLKSIGRSRFIIFKREMSLLKNKSRLQSIDVNGVGHLIRIR